LKVELISSLRHTGTVELGRGALVVEVAEDMIAVVELVEDIIAIIECVENLGLCSGEVE
jgi:hypothetical protein